MGGAVFAVPCAIALLLVPPNFVLHRPSAALVPVLIISIVGVLLTWGLATILGAYDLLLIIAGALALALAFGASYSMDVQSFLPDDGHTFFDVMTFGARPFDFEGQAKIFVCLLLWCAGMVGGGIALERARRQANSQAMPAVARSLWLWLTLDVLVIAGVTSLALANETSARIAEGQPVFLIHTLTASTSSVPEKLNAIRELSMADDARAIAALRQATQAQPPPVNITAALTLLERDDLSGLPLIEDAVLKHQALMETPWSVPDLETYLGMIKDSSAIPSLARLMGSPRADVRRGAARALSHMANNDAVEPLVKGLDDTDQEVRYRSVCGLIFVVGDGHYPAEGKFLENEDSYLKTWRDWAKAHQTASL